ncbi:MAG: ABC-ATPase domain-containing protein [Myxococcota bacterium]
MPGAAEHPDAIRLAQTLQRIDGRGYGAYKDLRGAWAMSEPACVVFIDHVQGDPFAAPSKLRVRVERRVAGWPDDLATPGPRRTALADWLARRFRDAIRRGGAEPGGRGRGRGQRGGGGHGKSGLVEIDAGGQEVLERSALVVGDDWIEARIQVGLPAAGRRILGRAAEELLCQRLPRLVSRSLLAADSDAEDARRFVECVENQEAVRERLGERGLVAFVGDGALLPRESGASDRPLRGPEGVPFESPPTLAVEIEVPNPPEADPADRTWRGLGIAEGVTLIVGGGYHGKSTLLRALERGVHPHVPGDGRERVVARPDLVKIRAEDGRAVTGVDIHAFIDRLPAGRSTRSFTSEDASGSTSQAANIVEALEAGSRGLLLDEDTSATNFMVRDARMQALVHREHEPITPFVDRVGDLWKQQGVSTVLVMGGCGDYFEVADRVIAMRDYRAHDVTDEARRIAGELPSARRQEPAEPLRPVRPRVPRAEGFDARRGRREVKIDARGRDLVRYGTHDIDLRAVEQILDPSQTRAIGLALHRAASRLMDGRSSVPEILDALEALLDHDGLGALDPFGREGEHPGALARPRRYEIAAALGRLRTLRVAADPDASG